MASEKRTAADSLSLPSTRPPPGSETRPPPSADDAGVIRDDLLANGRFYDFYYTVGMLERLDPLAARVGGDGPYDRESIRFRHDPSLGFKAGDVTKIELTDKPKSAERALEATQQRFELTTSFIGLTGTISPLPLYVAEEILQAQDADAVRRDFLDLFHHRIVSFVYRIGVKYDFAREYLSDASDPWSRRILALAGIDAWSGRKLRHVPLWRLLRLAPLLASNTRSARTFELVFSDVLGEALGDATVRIDQFKGGWTGLDEAQRMALGERNYRLGEDSVLGKECFDKAGKAVIVLGPLGENFRRFLADGDMYPVVIELISLLARDPIEFALELQVDDAERPPFRLGVVDGGRVGIDSWLSSGSDTGALTRVEVELPTQLPDDPSAFNLGWQSRPQRQ